MTQVALYLVTKEPKRALRELLGDRPKPNWIRVVNKISAIQQIPDGSRCLAIWFHSRKFRCPLEWAWWERRRTGWLEGLTERDYERLEAWRRDSQDEIDFELHVPAPEVLGMAQTERRVS